MSVLICKKKFNQNYNSFNCFVTKYIHINIYMYITKILIFYEYAILSYYACKQIDVHLDRK